MATSKEYMDYILDQLSGVEGITHRKMMGEYILYIHGRIAAYVCDDRWLVMPDAPMEAPYPGAKEMLLVEDTDDRVLMEHLLQII